MNLSIETKKTLLVNTIAQELSNIFEIVTEDLIIEKVTELNKNPLFLFEDSVVDTVIKELLERLKIKMDDPISLLGVSDDDWYKPDEYEEKKYWKRYKTFLLDTKHFGFSVIDTLDKSLNEIISNLGNPKSHNKFNRKGLVIGDVQSGKTATYTGLISKAADAGYKVFILLTGVMEDLRRQTQFRLDEGFIGIRSDDILRKNHISRDKYIGVGKIDKSIDVISLTSTELDFQSSTAKSLGIRLESLASPLLFVVKKNKSVLVNLYQWLKAQNADQKGEIHFPMLLIDDEADNASLNTKKDDEDPTQINARIRDLLSLFSFSNYIGFTATPFANIFVSQDYNGKYGDDLFPKDFITLLSPPTNYIGIESIFSEEGEYQFIAKTINDMENHLPINHDKEYDIESLPNSLVDALLAFFLANTIRDLKNDKNSHRSMMINITRFTRLQNMLSRMVLDLVIDIQNNIRLFARNSRWNKNIFMVKLNKVWKKEYKQLNYKWNDIRENIFESISKIEVRTINSSESSSKLNYNEYPNGLRVIVIGGMSLSRGLTLEGLMISYFYRNSKMYDTLLQMGRWFGYRPGYEKLCRIWMSNDLRLSFSEIGDAIRNLKDEIRLMKAQGKKPIDFGLMVKCSADALLITAPNKMRNAKDYELPISLNESVLETAFLYADKDINKYNLKCVDIMIENIKSTNSNFIDKVFKDVDKNIVANLIKSINIPYVNLKFNQDGITDFILNNQYLLNWDVAFIEGNGSSHKAYYVYNEQIMPVIRNYSVEDMGGKKIISISQKHRRLGGTGDTKYGLSKSDIEYVQAKYDADPNNRKSDGKIKGINQKAYLKYLPKRNPLLMVYFIELVNEEESKNCLYTDIYLGFGIAIPRITDDKSIITKYKINFQKYRELVGLAEEDDNDEQFN